MISIAGDHFAVWYGLRQRRLARERCTGGHDFATCRSFHLGSWRACSRCGLIVPLAARRRPAPHLKVRVR